MQDELLPGAQAIPSSGRTPRKSLDSGHWIGWLFLAVVLGFGGVQGVRHWLWEGAWATNGIAGEGTVLRYRYYEVCTDNPKGGTSCTDVADLHVAVAEPAAPGGVVTRDFVEVAVSDLHWIQEGRTLDVYRDPRPPWDFVLKTDHPAVPWKALGSLALCLLSLAGATYDVRERLKSRPHRSTGQTLPKWVRRPRTNGPATGTPWV